MSVAINGAIVLRGAVLEQSGLLATNFDTM